MSDLLVARTRNNSGSGPVAFRLFDPNSGLTSGIQLLGQRVIALLLRDFDNRFNRGTVFLQSIRTGVVNNDPTLVNIAALAMVSVQNQLPTEGPSDELLESFRIVNATRSNDGVAFTLQITSQAGETVVFQTPRIL